MKAVLLYGRPDEICQVLADECGGEPVEIGDEPLILADEADLKPDLPTDETPATPKGDDVPTPDDATLPLGTPKPGKGEDGDVTVTVGDRKTVFKYKDGKYVGSTVTKGNKTFEFDEKGKLTKAKVKGDPVVRKSKGDRVVITSHYEFEFDGPDDEKPRKILVVEICIKTTNGKICTTKRTVVDKGE